MNRLSLEFVDAYDPRVETIWRGLESVATPPYFLTWGWTENWLACLPREDAPPLAVVSRDGAPIAAFFVGKRLLFRHGVLPTRARFLNSTGVPRLDELCIEHNAMLCAPDARLSLAELIALLPHDWDELFLPAVDPEAFPDLAYPPGSADLRVRIDHEVAAPLVDLSRVRGSREGYVGLLGASTRSQIRRARRAAAELGELKLEVAEDALDALCIYEELVALHQHAWHQKGEPGAFADPWFDAFHRRLIATRHAHGEIQLVRLRAGGTTVGCLYNFVAGGRVLFYQSGLGRFDDRHMKPGYLCHAAAIERAAADGLAIYDLLGGDARYKKCLATDEARLVWLRVQRPLARFAIEDSLRRIKHAVRAFRDTVAQPQAQLR